MKLSLENPVVHCALGRPASAQNMAESCKSTPRARLSRVLSFGRRKKQHEPNMDAQAPATAAPPPASSRRPSFSRRQKADAAVSVDATSPPKAASSSWIPSLGSRSSKCSNAADDVHDGRLVGANVVFLKSGSYEELAGVRGEAILYDYYECMYTVSLGHRRRVQVPPEAIKKA